jgi:undecaprenyl pyrophosphate phosphatase UppP
VLLPAGPPADDARIARFLSTFLRGERGDRTTLTHPLSLVMIAFVCTAVPSLLLTKLIGKHLESLTVMGISLLAGGVIMWIVDAYFGSPRTVGRHMTERMEDVSLVQAIWIGICQVAISAFSDLSCSPRLSASAVSLWFSDHGDVVRSWRCRRSAHPPPIPQLGF